MLSFAKEGLQAIVVEVNHFSLRSGENARNVRIVSCEVICNFARHFSPKNKCLIRQELLLALDIAEKIMRKYLIRKSHP